MSVARPVGASEESAGRGGRLVSWTDGWMVWLASSMNFDVGGA